MGLSKSRSKRRKQADVAATNNGAIAMDFAGGAKIPRAAKLFADQAGGLEEARKALDALAMLEK
jgi:hypothetical protein